MNKTLKIKKHYLRRKTMGSCGQIVGKYISSKTTKDYVKEFLEIISPLGYDIDYDGDDEIYMRPAKDSERGVRVWISEKGYDDYDSFIYIVNEVRFFRRVFFDFVWDDERHGIESMNTDMVLAITAEYMKKYPDALFHYEWISEESYFLDKSDIETIILKPFDPRWIYTQKSHIHWKEQNNSYSWTSE